MAQRLTELEKIEVAQYVVDLLDSTKAGIGNDKNEHGTWMERAKEALSKRLGHYLKSEARTDMRL
jgi:hypothetical protein